MKRYRAVSHGDNQWLEAPTSSQRRRQSDGHQSSDEVSHNENSSLDTSKNPNDARLCLLSYVCDQHLSNKKSKKSHGQREAQNEATEMTQKVADEKDENKETVVSVLKSAEDVLGIMSPVVISPSVEDNADLSDVSCSAEDHVDKPNYIPKDYHQSQDDKTKSESKDEEVEKEEKEEPPSLWKEFCRPVPLPPRLPMVPAGYIFPLYKAPDTV